MNKFIDKFSPDTQRKIIRASKKGAGSVYSVFRLVILLAIGFIIIYPLFHMIVTSLQSKEAFLNSTRVWIPNDFAIKENYKAAFGALEYVTAFISTFKNEIISAAIEVCTCAVIAYGFARFDFKKKSY